jgi:hypothetical protein
MNEQLELTDQQLHRASGGGDTQADRILARLRETPGEWVPMPELARIGSGKLHGYCMVHSRVADLRKRGHDIEQRGGCESEYRLREGNWKAES